MENDVLPAAPHSLDAGWVIQTLSPPKAMPPPAPRLGGMATPLGVYLHDGISSGGAGFWGLVLTGMTMSMLAITAQLLGHVLSHVVSARLPALGFWESHLPYGLPLLLPSISPWLPLPLVFLLLRLVPLSGIHAAEHQVVHCMEHYLPLSPAAVRAMPRVHPRCGTNLFAGFTLFLLLFLVVFSVTQSARWQVPDSITLALVMAGPVTLIHWRRVGGWIQQRLATRPATDAQISGAIQAAEQVLARREQQMQSRQPRRFTPLRRLWIMGIGQILLGYAVVIGLLSAAGAVWPGLTHWLE